MALSGKISTAVYTSSDGRRFTVSCDWTATQNISNNNSTISWQLVFNALDGSGWINCGELRLTFGSEVIYYRASSNVTTGKNGVVFASGSKTMGHNADGSLSFNCTVEAGIYQYAINKSGSGTITLNQIPRAANITAAPNFNDEENPTINYSNLAGNSVNSLQACIADSNGQAVFVGYRDINKTGNSYTFPLSEAERNSLRAASANANSITVRFYVKTVIGSNTYYSYLARTLTIINGSVIINPSVIDTNPTTIVLTGDSNKLVKYYSNAAISIGAAARKGASITAHSVTNGSNRITAATGTFNAVESGSFAFSATDSRGNVVNQTVNKTFINYVKLTCNINKANPDTSGNLNLIIDGNYFNGSFGAVSNSLNVEYRYKVAGGDYGAWTTANITTNGNSYTATHNISGLDYQTNYVFQARATDRLISISSGERSVKTLPVFDWSKEDFNFNVPVSINGNVIIDFVMEQGTVSGWNYRKWSSGVVEAWYSPTINVTTATPYGNGYYNGSILTANLPSGLFIMPPSLTVSCMPNNAQIYNINIAAIGTNNISYYISSFQSNGNTSMLLHFSAYGFWK